MRSVFDVFSTAPVYSQTTTKTAISCDPQARPAKSFELVFCSSLFGTSRRPDHKRARATPEFFSSFILLQPEIGSPIDITYMHIRKIFRATLTGQATSCEFLLRGWLNKQTSALRNFSTASISLETVIVRTTKSDLRSHWSFCVCCHSVISTALSRSVHVNTPNISNSPLLQPEIGSPIEKRMCTHACGVGKTLTDQVATLVSFKALVQQ